MSETPIVEIFSDGACSGNPGPGGWGTLLRYGDHVRELSGYEPETTNNRMELCGAIAGLKALKRPSRVRLTTDSQYVKKGMTEWLAGWIRKGWKNSQKKPVANRDLWEQLVELEKIHQVEWCWVRGHAGHPENERCDELARQAIVNRSGIS
ncbi:ribonuclease HI [Geothermobacter hydrogeniphilus]|uniref:Ribonuclease H n=1 Tax=Geothermobacter hydrogeniphilus TaxID=1969733 RepID=A0A2K2HER4_9BACT|nr:ribonuclease HI [Geothermobacter hydrogeniphilus]PNU21743.1 ribonuclease HI [Geothermobacter hydrogeniphilus]